MANNKDLRNRLLAIVPSVLYFFSSLILLRVWKGAAGYDVYYYALQIKSLSLTGDLLFQDNSPVYQFIHFLNIFFKNPVLSVQVTSALCGALIYFALISIALVKQKNKLFAFSIASIMVFNPSFFYFQMEFTKNLFALTFLILGILLTFCSMEKKLPLSIGIIFLIISFISHRFTAIVVILLALQQIVEFSLKNVHFNRHKLKILIVFSILIFLAIIFTAYSWNKYHDRLSSFSFTAAINRINNFLHSNLHTGERIWYLLIQFLIPFSLIFTFTGKLKIQSLSSLFFILSQVMVFPFLAFSWDGLGFRFLLLAPVFFFLWILFQNAYTPKNNLVPIVLILLSGSFFTESLFVLHKDKYPDYRVLDLELADLEYYTHGKKLVAHRGLAGYLWFEKGIWTENFMPTKNTNEYYRLVYGFKEEMFTRFVNEEETFPGFSTENYLLIPETVWQRFYQQHQDLLFLKSEINPFLPRPVTGFRINEDAALIMSPVTFNLEDSE